MKGSSLHVGKACGLAGFLCDAYMNQRPEGWRAPKRQKIAKRKRERTSLRHTASQFVLSTSLEGSSYTPSQSNQKAVVSSYLGHRLLTNHPDFYSSADFSSSCPPSPIWGRIPRKMIPPSLQTFHVCVLNSDSFLQQSFPPTCHLAEIH